VWSAFLMFGVASIWLAMLAAVAYRVSRVGPGVRLDSHEPR
jgi:hypothetical protein